MKILTLIKEFGHWYILEGTICGDQIDLGEGVEPQDKAEDEQRDQISPVLF